MVRASSWAPARSSGRPGCCCSNASAHTYFVTDVLPALLVFSVGLSMTVAPLTAAVLAGVDGSQAGIASGVNNAIARVAGLIGTAAVGAVVAASFASTLDQRLAHVPLGSAGRTAVEQAKRLPLGLPEAHGLPPPQARALRVAAEQASVHSFHLGLMIAAVLLAAGGLIGALGIRNPRGRVRAAECAQGQFVGVGARVPEPAQVGAHPA